jgi:hypothetical protein
LGAVGLAGQRDGYSALEAIGFQPDPRYLDQSHPAQCAESLEPGTDPTEYGDDLRR